MEVLPNPPTARSPSYPHFQWDIVIFVREENGQSLSLDPREEVVTTWFERHSFNQVRCLISPPPAATMGTMSTPVERFCALVSELGFTPVNEGKALGAVAGIPTTISLLSDEPLGVLFAFRVHPDGRDTGRIVELLRDAPPDQASLSFDDGCASLTLYDRVGLTNESIRWLVEQVADAIGASDLALGPGCLRCGKTDGAELMCAEGRPTRLCPGCLNAAIDERQKTESELNRPSVLALLGLPGACVGMAAGWAGVWTLLDIVLQKLGVKVIEINRFTLLVILGLLAGIGLALGWPLGSALPA
jgi:hypothetical protein